MEEVVCEKCGSNSISYSLHDVEKKDSFIMKLIKLPFKIIIFIFLTPIWLLRLILGKKRKVVQKTFAVCQSCGNSWQTE